MPDQPLTSEALLATILGSSEEAIIVVSSGAQIVGWNAGAEQIFSWTRDEIIGRPLSTLVPPEMRADFEAVTARIFRGERITGHETVRVRKDGVRVEVSSTIAPVRDEHGEVVAAVAMTREIGALRRAELVRREQQFLSEDAQALAHVGTWSSGLTGGNDDVWSDECFRILGVERGPMTLDEFLGHVHPGDVDAVRAAHDAALASREPTEVDYRIIRPDGEVRWLHVRGMAARDQAGRPVRLIGVVQDITDRRRATDELRASAARARRIFETTTEGVWTIDADARTTFANARMAAMLGCTLEEMLGSSMWDFLDEEGRAISAKNVERRKAGVAEEHDSKFIRRDGATLWAKLSTSPLFDADGRYEGALAFVTDVTAARHADETRTHLEAQLRQSQKMEAIGRLAGGVAHDFNNLLSVIITYAALLLARDRPGSPSHDALEEIQRAAERAATLTRQLLAFSRKQALKPAVVDPNQIIGRLEGMLRRLVGEDIELTLAADARARVLADPSQIEQVIMNLVVNARDAMPTGGKLAIQLSDVVVDEERAAGLGITPGPCVKIIVSDSGVGMDGATCARVFEPFFTTKKEGGTGLGLSTVFGIVRQTGGAITVASAPGAGTTFEIHLPRTESELPSPSDAPPPLSPRGSETILLVEDEEQVRKAANTVLRQHGYNVLEAQSPGDALLACEQYGARIDLLVTDVVMPRMNGRQLADRVTALRPETRVLYMSGHVEHSIAREGIFDQGIAFVSKPFTPEGLLRKVREALGGGRS